MSDTEVLRGALEQAVVGLPEISWKRMFGCDAVFREGTIFGLIWKEGRIGLKFVESVEFEARMSNDGSSPWVPGGRPTKHWVLLPEDFASDAETLKEWASASYESII